MVFDNDGKKNRRDFIRVEQGFFEHDIKFGEEKGEYNESNSTIGFYEHIIYVRLIWGQLAMVHSSQSWPIVIFKMTIGNDSHS